MDKYLNKILAGDCIDVMRGIPDASVDAVFADSPYNLQLGEKTLYRPEDQTAARAVRDEWDAFESMTQYDEFTRKWMPNANASLNRTAHFGQSAVTIIFSVSAQFYRTWVSGF